MSIERSSGVSRRDGNTRVTAPLYLTRDAQSGRSADQLIARQAHGITSSA